MLLCSFRKRTPTLLVWGTLFSAILLALLLFRAGAPLWCSLASHCRRENGPSTWGFLAEGTAARSSSPPVVEGILEWTGRNSSLTLLDGHPGVNTLQDSQLGYGFRWIELWGVASGEQLQARALEQGCEVVASAVLAGFWVHKYNFYHFMQDYALPAFVLLPDAKVLRFFASEDYPEPAGHTLTKDWLPFGVEGLPLRGKDPAQPHCVAIHSMRLMTPKYGLNFAAPQSRLRADSHINNMRLLAQRVAGDHFPLASTPREVRGHEEEPLVVRVAQRRGGAGLRNFEDLESVLEETRQRLANRGANGDPLPIDLAVMYFEDFQDDKQALLQYMQSVDVLVGFHGAGMTNMMFMRPCSSVTQVVLPMQCFWLAAEVFEGLAYMSKLPYSQLCLTMDNVKMIDGENRAEEDLQAVRMDREVGSIPDHQLYLYRIDSLRVTPAEMESVVRAGVRSNLLCRTVAEQRRRQRMQ